jgi:hypothetical protein
MDDVSHVSPREYLAGVRLVGGTVIASAAMLLSCGWLAIGGSAYGTSRALDEPDPVQLDVTSGSAAAPFLPVAPRRSQTRHPSRRVAPRPAPVREALHRAPLRSPRHSAVAPPSPTPATAPTPVPPAAATPVPPVTVAPRQLPAPVEVPTVTLPTSVLPAVPVVDQVVSAVGSA